MRFIILTSLLLISCGPTEEQVAKARTFELERICTIKHGTPVMENGEFKQCDYVKSPFSFHIDHKSDIKK